MSAVSQYLDCGCAILQGGGRDWCPSCMAGHALPRTRVAPKMEKPRPVSKQLAVDAVRCPLCDRVGSDSRGPVRSRCGEIRELRECRHCGERYVVDDDGVAL